MIIETEEFVILHNSLYFKEYKTLVLADIHLGYDESVKNKGVLLSLNSTKNVFKNLKKIICELEKNKYILQNIVFNGDIKHEFASVLYLEDKIFRKIIGLSDKYNIIFIKGNHDKLLDNYMKYIKNEKVILTDMVTIHGKINYCITHGDDDIVKLFSKRSNRVCLGECVDFSFGEFKKYTFVIGHEHPVISISDNYRIEKYKALLLSKKLIVLPSFNHLVQGVNFNQAFLKKKYFSPILNDLKVSDFSAYLFFGIDDDIFYFPSIKDLV